MTHATEDLSANLRRAREAKGISQRELSRLTGVPQGHISKIESGTVDIRVSSLIALARALGLEVTLVPRQAVPAVQSIARQSEGERGHSATRDLPEMLRTLNIATRPAYTLDDEDGDE